MCGIAGILNLKKKVPIDGHLLCRMMSAIRHRGPDESGLYIDPHIGLGHVRLSIIGLAGGGQPISNEDGTLWIIYNGEVFNYIELKQELIKKGHTFSTETDTEVILHLYEDLGPACLEKLNGQFALAIWNSRKKELFLARDRVGIRPLFYVRTGDKMLFASEIKALFVDPDVKRTLDPESLYQVFTFWTTVGRGTAFKDIYELPPGHFMLVKDGKMTIQSYWSLPYFPQRQNFYPSVEAVREELEPLLKDAVRIRLRADVPVGAYLSGGLDSSLTTAIIARYFNNRLKTFSIGFEEHGFDEQKYQKEMVTHLGTDHRQTLATNRRIRQSFPDLIWHCEKPVLRTAPVPLFLLSRLVTENDFKVVLTGEGADEVFGGYNIFKEAKVRQFWGRQPESRLRPMLLERLYPYVFQNPSRGRAFLYRFYAVKAEELNDPLFSHRIRWNNTGKNRTFFADHIISDLSSYRLYDQVESHLPTGFEARDYFSRAQYLEMAIFLSNYLLSSQGDRPAMAHSLEIRLPFLDYRLIEFASRLPANWKINGLDEKYILKKSFNGLIPDQIKKRTKQPYRAPIKEVFFAEHPSDYVDEMLSEDYLKKVGLFNEKKVQRLLAKYRNSTGTTSSEVHNMAVVGIISTQLIHHQFIENFPWKPIEPLKPDKIIKKNS